MPPPTPSPSVSAKSVAARSDRFSTSLRLARLAGNDADFVAPTLMLAELRSDNERLAGFMRDAHFVCGGFDDVASMGLLENWIDEAEQRVWFLFECGRKG